MPSGGHLVTSHFTSDFDAPSTQAVADDLKTKGTNITPRTRSQVAVFFDGPYAGAARRP